MAASAYSSQPSSPAYEMRWARTGTSSSSMGRAVMYGNASPLRSSGEIVDSRARASGPVTSTAVVPAVVSSMSTRSSGRRARRR